MYVISVFIYVYIVYFQLAAIVNRCIIRRTQALLTQYLPVKSMDSVYIYIINPYPTGTESH